MIINAQTGTNVREIADGIYRINTRVDLPDDQAFNFNQYLFVDYEPLLFRRDGAAPLLAFHLQVDADVPTRLQQRTPRAVAQSQQSICICIDGHRIEPKEQNTQQSPVNERSSTLHPSHS
jgi:hypothetical protein